MTITIPENILTNLRQCQLSSIETIDKYVRSKSQGSCLISLPTGAGKTGVISVVANLVSKKNILIVTHRRAVCNQLYKNLKGDFFNKIDKGSSKTLVTKNVFNGVGTEDSQGIFCTTFQTLSELDEENLLKFKNKIDLILIDEGHAEPSHIWSLLIRGFNTKKVVITATPYRNDLFSFDIDINHNFIYTFSSAIKDGIICRPYFLTVDNIELLQHIENLFKQYPETKCVVKCKDVEAINQYYNFFKETYPTLAIHDRFKNSTDENCVVSVPNDLSESNYKILIHQRKLDEGVDLPSAKISVLTYPVGSGKELVQTVGRVVRVFKKYPAFVIETKNTNKSNSQLWENYLEFDSYLSEPFAVKKFLQTLDTSKLIEKYIQEFPEYSYFDSVFKKKFDFKAFNPVQELEIPLASVCFYKKPSDFSLVACMDILHWNNEREGCLSSVKINENDKEGINYYITFNNSKFLRNTLFFQPSLEVTIVKELENIVAVFDSRGRSFISQNNLKIYETIDADTLFKMASQTVKSITKQANTIALDKSDLRAEGISLKSKNLEKINHSQSNTAYAVTTAVVSNLGDNDNIFSKYYLGISSGRISDQKRHKFSYQEFIEWLDNVNNTLKANTSVNSPFLNSYAQQSIVRPSNPPLACMFDFTDIENCIEIEYLGNKILLENTFFYFDYKDGINILGTNKYFEFKFPPFTEKSYKTKTIQIFDTMSFIYASEKIRLIITEENSIVPIVNPNYKFYLDQNPLRVEDIFNSERTRLIFEDGITFYNGFYQIRLPDHSSKLNQNIVRNIIDLPCLKRQGLSEKGKANSSNHFFDEDSIFFEIDKISNIHKGDDVPLNELGEFYRYIPDLDLMLLTDLGTEPADFIISSPSKIIYVHVKCGTSSQRPTSPAGALCEVGGQALKNIHNLITRIPRELANDTYLRNGWKLGNNYVLDSRIRLFNKVFNPHTNLDNVFDVIKQRSSNPLVEKEIWVVAGNSFSRKYFLNQFDKIATIDEETIQAYQLLDAWFAQASNHNVNLKFFVSE